MRGKHRFRVDHQRHAWSFSPSSTWVDESKDGSVDTRTPQEALVEPLTMRPTPPGHGSRAAGYMMLLVTAFSWGINWPVGKHLLAELPPLTMRGAPGALGAALLALVVLGKGQSLRVPREQWLRLVVYSVLSVTGWMALI